MSGKGVLDIGPGLRGHSVTVEQRSSLDGGLGEVWDRRVGQLAGADVTQLRGWGRLRRSAGYEPSWVLAFVEDTLVGGAQLLRRPLPVLGEIAYLPYGPLIFTTDHRDEIREALCRRLRDTRALDVRALFVQPPDGAEDTSEELLDLGFRPSEAGVAPRCSICLDLARPIDELRAGLGKKLRRWVRRWPERGVRVRIGDESDIPLLARLHACTAEHRGFPALSEEYLLQLYRELAPLDSARIFVGGIEGRPVAAAMTTGCGGMLKTRISGFDRSEAAAELRVPAAVRWTAITWAKEQGYRWFDFGGLSESTTEQLLSDEPVDPSRINGSDQFKLSFGGSAYRLPQPVELIESPTLRHGYGIAKRIPGGQQALAVAKAALRGGRS